MKYLSTASPGRSFRTVQIVIGIGVAIFLLITSSVRAQDSAGYRKTSHRSWNGLTGLTEDQEHKIEGLRTQLEKEMLTLDNQLAEKRAHLRTLETADKADEKAINSTIDEIGQLQIQTMKKQAALKQAVRKLLTDEQRLQFDARSRAPFIRKIQSHPVNRRRYLRHS